MYNFSGFIQSTLGALQESTIIFNEYIPTVMNPLYDSVQQYFYLGGGGYNVFMSDRPQRPGYMFTQSNKQITIDFL